MKFTTGMRSLPKECLSEGKGREAQASQEGAVRVIGLDYYITQLTAICKGNFNVLYA